MDLVATTPRRPVPGRPSPAVISVPCPGQGANQAYGAAKLSGDVAMVGSVGADGFGRESLANLRAVGVDTGRLRAVAGIPSGVALITVDDEANNAIVVVPGANALVAADDVTAAAATIPGAKRGLVHLSSYPRKQEPERRQRILSSDISN